MATIIKSRKFLNNKFSSEAGFSLIELIGSMVVFLVVTGAIYGVMNLARESRKVVSENVALNKSMRIGLGLIGRDTYNAGYGYPVSSAVVLPNLKVSKLLGIPADYDESRDLVPPIIPGNEVTLNTFNSPTGVLTDQVTFMFKDSTFNLTGPVETPVSQPLSILSVNSTGSDTIDEIVPVTGVNTACRINDLYLISGNAGATLGLATALNGSNKIQFSTGDILEINKTGPNGNIRKIVLPASIQRVRMVTYFVTADGILTRREYGNAPVAAPAVAFVDEPLVYGIENFQIKYVMDDGKLTDNPSAGADGILGNADDALADLAKIRQIIFTLSGKAVERTIGGKDITETLSSTFSTRNLGYEAN